MHIEENFREITYRLIYIFKFPRVVATRAIFYVSISYTRLYGLAYQMRKAPTTIYRAVIHFAIIYFIIFGEKDFTLSLSFSDIFL